MTATIINQIFEEIRQQKAGFSFGKPQRPDAKILSVVLPFLREGYGTRDYITFPETDRVLVFDTGKIDEMRVENDTDDKVFIRSGTLFTGATQTRAAQRSHVIMPHSKGFVPVRCVYASHGITGNAAVKYGGVTPLDTDKKNYNAGYMAKSQGEYWSNVHGSNICMMQCSNTSSFSASVGAVTPGAGSFFYHQQSQPSAGQSAPQPAMDDLAGNFDKFAVDFEKILAKVKRHEHQIGLALITDGGVQTIEWFDHGDSWKAFHDAAIKRLGPDLIREDPKSVFEFKPEVAIEQVNEVLSLPFKTNRIFQHRVSAGTEIEITGLTAKDFVGEVTTVDGDPIHIVLLKKAD